MLISRSNLKIKFLESLRQGKERRKTGYFLVEGERELTRAKEIASVYYHTMTPFLVSLAERGVQLIHISKRLLEKVSIRGEIVGICKQVDINLKDLKGNFFLALVGVEKPGNLGAILRSCDGAGVDGVLLVDSLVDQFHPNVVRTSLGANFSLNIARCSSREALEFIEEEEIKVFVTSPAAEKTYTDVKMIFPLMVVMGQEDKGLPSHWKLGTEASIPMQGVCDSLNVSVSTGIILYEVLRQNGI